MVYTMNEAQLLGLWTATRLLGEIRRVEDPMAQAELLTKAQILLTAFIAGLDPRICDQTSSATLRAGLDEMVAFDA
jgi:hypothetical protein